MKASYTAYSKSHAAEKLRQHLQQNKRALIAFFDMDGTFAYTLPHVQDAWKRELIARKFVYEYVEKHGVLATLTLRTPAMLMSEVSFLKTRKLGYPEPEAHLGFDESGKKRKWQDPYTLPELSYVLDWDIIGGVGSGILVRSYEGYYLDTDYHKTLTASGNWREDTMSLLRAIDRDGDVLKCLAQIEDEKNYLEGVTDVSPTPFRIQLNFTGEQGLLMKQEVMNRIIAVRQRGNVTLMRIARNIVFLDESKPEQHTYTLYILHKHAKKERKLDEIMNGLSYSTGIPIEDMELVIAGDTMTDLRAGMYAGGKARSTFILVGGSRLAPYLVGDKRGQLFAGESLSWLLNMLTNERSRGIYDIHIPLRGSRTLVIGDTAFPGTYGPETIAQWIETRT